MSTHKSIQKLYFVITIFIVLSFIIIIITNNPIFINKNYFVTPNQVYAQQQDQINSNNTNSINIQDILAKKSK